MKVYESELTEANLAHSHIYITSFVDSLPQDVFGGTNRNDPAEREVRLEYGHLHWDTFVTTYDNCRPRTFFQRRSFAREFFEATGAKAGDVVLFEEVTPYHFRLSLRTTAGKVITA